MDSDKLPKYYARNKRRVSRPLADAPTPYYLQRFKFGHNGETHIFDGSKLFGNNVTSWLRPDNTMCNWGAPAKRSQPAAPGVDGPAPKRRERDLDDETPLDDLHPSAFPTSADVLNSEIDTTTHHHNTHVISHTAHTHAHAHAHRQPPPAQTSPHASLSSPTPTNASSMPGLPGTASNSSSSATSGPTASQPQRQRRGSTTQPTLLSPTASPRSMNSPQSPDYRDMDGSGSERETSPPLYTPGTTGPPSARAYAPTPTLLGSVSPLHIPLLDPSATPQNSSGGALALTPGSTAPGTATQSQSQVMMQEALRSRLALLTDTFDRLPPAIHRYTLFQLFRSCSRSTLSTVFGELEQALRFDMLGDLPLELSSMVLQHLDVPSVVAASKVCKSWYKLVDGDEVLWQTLMDREALHFSAKDVETAKLERWGYSGWPTRYSRPESPPVNTFGKPVNIFKAVYRRLALIHHNWMSPDVTPRRYEIQCPDREVITYLDFSEDIIIASTEGKKHLNVYDTQTGTLLHEFTSHEGGVWALKRVGKDMIVSGSTDHTVRVWSLSKNRCTHVFRGHHATVRCLDIVMPEPGNIARNYPIILTGSRDTTMRIWRLPGPDDEDYDSKVAFVDKDNPYFVAELKGHEDSVRAVCGHGDVAVSGSYDFRVRVWDLNTHRCKHVLEGHVHKVYAAIIDPDRNRCISASMDMQIKIWDLDTGSQLYTLSGHTGLVGLLRLHDNTLVSAAADKTLRIWSPDDGSLSHCLTGHDSPILCFDHDGRRIVSGSESHLKLWDARTGAFARDLLTGIERIWQVSFDRRRCVAAVARGRSSYLEILDFDFEPPSSSSSGTPSASASSAAQGSPTHTLTPEVVTPVHGTGTVEEIPYDDEM